MRDRIFLDSNILVYSSLEDNENKHHKVISLLENIKGKEIFLSTQVINEVDDDAIQKVLMEIIETYNISVITTEIIKKAWNLRKQYRYSYWDSLVLASALEINCSTLYTEDMQGGQVIEDTLRITNPFERVEDIN